MIHPTAKVSEEVNRKSHAIVSTTVLQLSPLGYTDSSATMHIFTVTDSQRIRQADDSIVPIAVRTAYQLKTAQYGEE